MNLQIKFFKISTVWYPESDKLKTKNMLMLGIFRISVQESEGNKSCEKKIFNKKKIGEIEKYCFKYLFARN